MVVECIENSIQYCTAIIWIRNLITIHLLLSLPGPIVSSLLVLHDLLQFLQVVLGCLAHTLALKNVIMMFGMTELHWNEYIFVEYTQFYSLNQYLH